MAESLGPQFGNFTCVLNAWARHEIELRRYLAHHLSDPVLADDLVQEVFLKAIAQGKDFCRLDNPRAWLFQVARNALIDSHRLARPTVPLPDDLIQEEGGLAPVDALAECLPRVLAALPEEDRDILRKCDLDGIKQQAYADAHGLSLAATKSRLLRARQRMRAWMIENCQVGFDETGAVCCHAPRVDH
ncbi:sigma-70 family RNA polymerase sigma factor [Noviherbaspirillum sp.]|jgi:RNA polymerase sigma-70 factor (ECF subfamily)|uniref:sigma-70 family RNA polymerase sigma factor n=1 Tax=Noviherbaspirillum sp. TaxID=1926288 RepID=UPI0025E29BD1|nr:sigma-70 family RNA polymerase sigma factor [Noviherbaspirillum sp.]